MKQCDRCMGSGLITRQRRRFATEDGSLGEFDPRDILGQHKASCDKCGGSGEIPEKPVPIEARKGYAADLMTPLNPPIWASA